MKKNLIVGILIFLGFTIESYGQLTVEMCQEKARANYPMVKQYGLIEQAKEYSVSNAARGFLPRFSLSAKATYQSEVTKVPFSLPGVNINELNRDQYQVVAELNQTIWDGGHIQAQKKLAEVEAEVGNQQLNVDLYVLNDRVNQLFFGILLLDEQLKQNVLLYEELQRNYERVSACIANGVANEADLDAVKAEQVKVFQSRTELSVMRGAYERMLGIMIGEQQETKENEHRSPLLNLMTPSVETEGVGLGEIKRPELDLYAAQRRRLDVQRKTILAENMPQFGFFVQGGYSNPGLNMLKNEFSPWYVGGIRMSWNFGGLYTKKNQYRQISVSQEQVGLQKATFLFNTNLKLVQEKSEIQKCRELIKRDDELIALRDRIKLSAEAKVTNGTLTVFELLREINEGDQARQAKALHKIQLLMAIYNQKDITNN